MRKRLLLFTGTLAVLLGGFFVYQQFAGQDFAHEDAGRRPALRAGSTGQSALGVPTGNIPELDIGIFDERTGRQEARYRAASAVKRPDQRVHLERPHFEFYRENEIITITADRGEVAADEIGEQPNPRQGLLQGNVRVLIDRDTPEQRDARRGGPPSDAIDITIPDELHFDNDRLQLTAPGDVFVRSREANIAGAGLTVLWQTNPQTLRLLQLDHGTRIEILEGKDRFDLSPVGRDGADLDASLSGTGAQASAATTAAASEAAATATAAGSQPATPQVAGADPPRDPWYRLELRDNVRVTSPDGEWMRGADRLEMVFAEDEEDEEPAEPRPATARAAGRTETTATLAQATSRPRSQPVSHPVSGAADEPDDRPVVVLWDGPLVLTPLAKAGPSASEGLGRDYDIRAEGGNLAIGDDRMTALCRVFTFRREGRQGRLEGGPGGRVYLSLERGEQQIVGPVMRFCRDDGLAYVDGPGRMELRDQGAAAESPEAAPTAAPRTTPAEPERPVVLAWTDGIEVRLAALSDEADSRQRLDEADIRGRVRIRHADGTEMGAQRVRAKFRAGAPGEPRNVIDVVEAAGAVRLVESEQEAGPGARFADAAIGLGTLALGGGAAGDGFETLALLARDVLSDGNLVRADHLHAEMTRTPDGRTAPELTIASGRVLARQDGNRIQTNRLRVWLEAATAEERAPEEQPGGRRPFRPTLLLAGAEPEGVELPATALRSPLGALLPLPASLGADHVVLTDPDEGGRAEGIGLVYEPHAGEEPSANEAKIFGTPEAPARLTQRDSHIAGPVIAMTLPDPGASRRGLDTLGVDRAGTMRFYTDQDMNGRPLPEPVPVDLSWSGSLDYDGPGDRATVAGDVRLATPGYMMRCGQLELDFEPAAAPATPSASASVTDDVAGEAALGGMQRRRIREMRAIGDVVVFSARKDDEGFLGELFKLNGDRLVYNLRTQQMSVESPGELLMADMRAPRALGATATSGGATAAGGLERPSQSVFSWSHGMTYNRGTGRVSFDAGFAPAPGQPRPMERVLIRHRSGNQVLPIAGLGQDWPVRDFTSLAGGRAMTLAADGAEAYLVDAAEPGATASADAGLVGSAGTQQLQMFTADGAVTLAVGPFEASAGRMQYDAGTDMAILHGDAAGGGRPAIVTQKVASGPPPTFTGPRISINLARNVVLVDGAHGTGR